MADLNARIKPKKSSVSGEVPSTSDLDVAEIAINTADGKLFVKHTDDTIKEISGSGGLEEAPQDGNQYARQNAAWTQIAGGANGGVGEAPVDGKQYARKDAAWAEVDTGDSLTDAPQDGKQYARQDGDWEEVEVDFPVDSVNGQVGAVSLGVLDMNDVSNDTFVTDTVRYNYGSSTTNLGTYKALTNAAYLQFNNTDADGFADKIKDLVEEVGPGGTLYVSVDGGDNWYQRTLLGWALGGNFINVEVQGEWNPDGGYVTAPQIYVGSLPAITGDPTPPDDGDILQWDASTGNFLTVPIANVGGVGEAPLNGQQYARQSGGWAVVATGGGAIGSYLSETQTSDVSGHSTYVGMGHSGILQKVTANADCWITLYPTAAFRTSDAGRLFTDAPTLGGGVLAEFKVDQGEVVYATPGTSYYNGDDPASDAIYVALRAVDGTPIEGASVTIDCFGETDISNANPAKLRAALGIGEYPTNSDASIGGVRAGALYFNSTTSDYRLRS